ncbi:hypothetical protein BKA64DRAFT_125576 [Cadophora sp. MPI-SDFR-AT-0126]|nr:hypothetical protein BKA64DRAFT_125576 [Leotiomycetes sp. MPI-SDFR-AT-0126]
MRERQRGREEGAPSISSIGPVQFSSVQIQSIRFDPISSGNAVGPRCSREFLEKESGSGHSGQVRAGQTRKVEKRKRGAVQCFAVLYFMPIYARPCLQAPYWTSPHRTRMVPTYFTVHSAPTSAYVCLCLCLPPRKKVRYPLLPPNVFGSFVRYSCC